MLCKLLLVFFTILSVVKAQAHGYEKNVINCEPKILNKNEKIFVNKYDMETGFFIAKTIYFSKITFPDAIAGTGDRLSSKTAHHYRVLLSIKKTKHFEPMRRSVGITYFFHIYYGDTATCHTFHPVTGEYKKQRIGFHTLKYFCVVPSGHYVGVDFEKHQGEKYAFIGVTPIRSKLSDGNLDSFTKEEMLERFPQHRKIIEEYYGQSN